jgi:uncharacterized RDD family membrane protein YckC
MYRETLSHLPDPERQSAFYEGVTIKRGIAWAFDFVIIAALMVPIIVMTAFIGLFFFPILFAIVGFVYRVLTIAGGSATWGMRMMSIEFRNAWGERLDLRQAFLHTLGYTFSLMIPVVQIASIICMFVTERGQGLTDMALGTVALNKRA